MSDSGFAGFYSLRELRADSWFLPGLVASLALIGAILAGIIAWTHDNKIFVQPIANVIALSGTVTGFEVKPISEIADAKSVTVAFTGYAVPLTKLCIQGEFSNAFSDAFRKGSAKLVFTQKGTDQLTVANANVDQDTCKLVARDQTRFQNVSAVFSAQVPNLSDDFAKRLYFVPQVN